MLKLKSPPIVEAVLDIDCDLPPASDLAVLEAAASERLRDAYPISKKRLLHEMEVKAEVGEAPQVMSRHGVQALMFCAADEKQLIQFRPQGYSFNRLVPYTSLDDYLPEIERTWQIFRELTAPVQVRMARLRYINRLPLPADESGAGLGRFLKLRPRLPAKAKLTLAGFFSQHAAVDPETGNAVNITVATQPREGDKQPVILDIEAYCAINAEPGDWDSVAERIQSLRRLKNAVFEHSLTRSCLQLFR